MNVPSIKEIQKRIENNLITDLDRQTPVLPHAFVRIISVGLAGVFWSVYKFIEWIKDQFFAITADGDELQKVGREVGVYKRPATYTKIGIVPTGTEGVVIPIDTAVTIDSLVYYTTASGVVGDDYIIARAEETGADYNFEDDIVEFSFESSITDVDDTGNAFMLYTGADEMTEEAYRQSILFTKQNPRTGGNDADYERWCENVAPVTDAYIQAQFPLPNSVTCVVANRNKETPTLTAPDVERVRQYVEQQASTLADIRVSSVQVEPVSITLDIDKTETTIKNSIMNNIKEYLLYTRPGGEVVYDDIVYAIKSAPYSFVINSLTITIDSGVVTDTFKLNYYAIPQLDGITWS